MGDELAMTLRMMLSVRMAEAEERLKAVLALFPVFADSDVDRDVKNAMAGHLDILQAVQRKLATEESIDAVTLATLLAEAAAMSGKAEATALGLGWVKALMEATS